MSKIICLGSLNLDYVYELPHQLEIGETVTSLSYRVGYGGKGGNQSIAAAKAGAQVLHAGQIGPDGKMLRQNLEDSGVDTSLLEIGETATGHAIVLINPQGDNSIVLYPGANRNLTEKYIAEVMGHGSQGDILLLQNETNQLSTAMQLAHHAGMKIAFNFAPYVQDDSLPLELVDYLFLNEIEGKGLSGTDEPERMIAILSERYPQTTVIVTAGVNGAYASGIHVPSPKVKVVDTTAAGDTFIGYFLNATLQGKKLQHALETACLAASICVGRPGTASSIPWANELEQL